MGEQDPQHLASESVAQKRRRESKSFEWLVFCDQDLRLLIGLPVAAILGIAMLIVGIVEAEAWMTIVGVIFALVSIGGLVAILKPVREPRDGSSRGQVRD